MTAFSYINPLPITGNDPGVDQPNMTINNASSESIWAVDHVGFNTTGPVGPPNGSGGQHLQVTFNGNNVPSLPAALCTLFSNTVAGLPQLFSYSGDAAHSSGQYVLGSNGSTFLLGGIILKWGTSGNIATNTPVNFASAFPNNCYTVVCIQNSSAGIPTTVSVGNFTTASFTFTFTGGGNRMVSYVAIGN